MMTRLINREDVDKVKGHANFGSADPYQLIIDAVLKCASGYASGHTVECMMKELGLMRKKGGLTKKGKRHLWEWYHIKNVR